MATEIDRLVVKIDADIASMEAKLNKVIGQNKNAAKQIKDAWGGGGNIFDALNKGFADLSKSAGSAASGVPGLGAALAALGPEGIAATVAIGGLIEALNAAREAVAWSAELQKTADSLHITTTALQQYQVALHSAGGDQSQVASSMQTFTEMLGKASDGVPKALKVFQELFGKSFTKEDVAKLGDASSALAVVNKEIQGLSKTQQEAVLSQFGLTGMKDLLELTPEKFREAQAEAGKLGLIMDASVVAKGKAINDELDKSFKKISVDWKTALTELGPILQGIVGWFAQVADYAARTVDRFHQIQNQQDSTLRVDLKQRQADDAKLVRFGTGPIVEWQHQKNLTDIAAMQQTLGVHELERIADARANGMQDVVTKHLTDVSTKKPVSDETGALTKAAADAYATSLRDLQTAQAALATTVDERVALEQGAIDADLSKKLVDLDAQEAAIHKAANEGKINRNAAAELANIAGARINDQQAALDKKRLIEQQASVEKLANENAHLDAVASLNASVLTSQAAHLTALAALAGSTQERADYNKRALLLTQQADRDALDAKIEDASAERDLAVEKKLSAAAIQKAQDKLNALLAEGRAQPLKQADQTAAQARADENPIQAYQRQIQSLNDTMENAGVSAAKSLADGLVDAIENAKSLGDVASNVFKRLIAEIASAALQKNLFSPILASLGFPAHAQGTLSSASGWALVGENGPEAVRLPGNSQVLSNQQLRNVGIGGTAGAAPTFVFDNRGAVIWEQAARAMMSYADRAAMGAGGLAISASRSVTPTDLARAGSRRLG